MTERFERSTELPTSAEMAFAWHGRPGAFERLTPPWSGVRVMRHEGGIEEGARHVLRIPLGPFWRTWRAHHTIHEPSTRFRDVQEAGPFASWIHDHIFEPVSATRSLLRDRIEFELPFGFLGRTLLGPAIRRDLARMFRHRHDVTVDDLGRHQVYGDRAPLAVAVSGASGLLGAALVAFLTTGGHRVVPLARGPERREGTARWSVGQGVLDLDALEGLDAVVHLAGENVAGGRWTAARMKRIRDSRVLGTRALMASLHRLARPPRVVIVASAVGFYGDRADEVLDEASAVGSGFLADVAAAWEDAARGAPAGTRVVHLRFGVVLSPRGGALARMLPPFRLGGGGRIGSGRQYLSWVHVDDAVAAVHHALMNDEVIGAVNVTAPEPVTNAVWTRTLAHVLRRPALIPLPASAARLMFGEMADHLLLASARALPRRLEATGFRFRHPDLDEALRALLGRYRVTAVTSSP